MGSAPERFWDCLDELKNTLDRDNKMDISDLPYCKNIVKILDNNATTLVVSKLGKKRPLVDD